MDSEKKLTRKEHLEWCKKRALELLDAGDPGQAIASMLSDLNKHDGTRSSVQIGRMLAATMMNRFPVSGEVRRFIEGFN